MSEIIILSLRKYKIHYYNYNYFMLSFKKQIKIRKLRYPIINPIATIIYIIIIKYTISALKNH